MKTREQIKDTLNKLLAMADDKGASETERDTAMRQAAKMMESHSIDMAELQESEFREEMGATGCDRHSRETNAIWRVNLWAAVAEMFNCKVVMTNDYIEVFGASLNRDNTKILSEWLCNSVTAEAKKKYAAHKVERKVYGERPDAPRTFHTSFGAGAARGIYNRVKALKAEKTKALPTATGSALIVINRDVALFNEAVAERDRVYPRLRTGSGSRVTSGSAFSQGKTYGGSVSLNTPSRTSGYLS